MAHISTIIGLVSKESPLERLWHTWLVVKNKTKHAIQSIAPNNPEEMKIEDEMLFWKLIDGECTEEEALKAHQLIQSSKEYQAEYEKVDANASRISIPALS